MLTMLNLYDEQWMDGKPDIHQQHQQHNIDYSENFIPPQSCPTQAIKVQNSLEIFMELEKIYDVPELTQLTPPHTPPQKCNDVKEIFDLISAHHDTNALIVGSNCNDSNNVIDIIPMALSPSNSDYSSDVGGPQSPMPSDIAREMQIVDEILRSRAEELPDWTDNDDNNDAGDGDDDENDDENDDDDDDNESMHSSSSSAVSSSFFSTSSNEWGTSSLASSSLSSPTNNSSTLSSTSGKIPHEKSQKKRTRPYGRPLEDKKVRKKEQNKNAATRYRQKKKQEMEEILEEERELAKHNENLTKKLTEIEREVKYLKQLIREFHKNKKLQ